MGQPLMLRDLVIIELIKSPSIMSYGILELYVPSSARENQLMGRVWAKADNVLVDIGDFVLYEEGRGMAIKFDGMRSERDYLLISQEFLLAKVEVGSDAQA